MTSTSHQTATVVREFMASLGVHLRQDWVSHCLGQIGGAASAPQAAKEEVYRTFLACDLREAGEAILPPGVGGMMKERVRGKMVVQVESARDIAKSFEQREKADGGSTHHTLKLALGDGRQTVAAFEYRRIQGLSADPPPGVKLLLIEPWVRRGILLLSSENTTVLGGEVSSLVEAREAARGQRNSNGAGTASAANGASDAAAGDAGRGQDRSAGTGDGPGSTGTSRLNSTGPAESREQQEATANGRSRDARSQPRTPRTESEARRGHEGDTVGFAARGPEACSLDSSRGVEGGGDGVVQSRDRGQRRDVLSSHRPYPPRVSNVVNPYAAVTRPVSIPAAVASRVVDGGGASEAGSNGATSRGESRARAKGAEARVPAFRDMEDDGPAFDYTEDPDFEDLLGQQSNPETQEPPEEVPENGRGDESASGNVSRRSRDAFEVGVSPPETPGSPLPPPVTPRPKIVTARVQHEKLRKDEGRRRARETREDIADIEGQHDGGGRAGRNRPSLKRPRTQVNSPGGDSDRDSDAAWPPRSPYMSLAELEGLTTAGGVHRVKAVVSDTMGCKLRKRTYLLVIEIEDGTAVVRVRLSEPITRRLFGVDAREFKKIFQADSDRAIGIQARVEQEIREMEGVMEIDMTPATSSTQSPATPGAALSQASAAASDAEWLLPVVLSVSPPTDRDCVELLARAKALL